MRVSFYLICKRLCKVQKTWDISQYIVTRQYSSFPVASFTLSAVTAFFMWFLNTKIGIIVFEAVFNFIFIFGWNALDIATTENYPVHIRWEKRSDIKTKAQIICELTQLMICVLTQKRICVVVYSHNWSMAVAFIIMSLFLSALLQLYKYFKIKTK